MKRGFVFCPGDFDQDTTHLTGREKWMYFRLLCYCHMHDGYLPDTGGDLVKLQQKCSIIVAVDARVFQKHWPVIFLFFTTDGDGRFYQKRARQDCEKYRKKIDRLKENGSRRWQANQSPRSSPNKLANQAPKSLANQHVIKPLSSPKGEEERGDYSESSNPPSATASPPLGGGAPAVQLIGNDPGSPSTIGPIGQALRNLARELRSGPKWTHSTPAADWPASQTPQSSAEPQSEPIASIETKPQTKSKPKPASSPEEENTQCSPQPANGQNSGNGSCPSDEPNSAGGTNGPSGSNKISETSKVPKIKPAESMLAATAKLYTDKPVMASKNLAATKAFRQKNSPRRG